MKKTTSLNLTNRLTKYSALSLAIAGIADANGQVVYTDVVDNVQPFDTEFLVNFNNDDPPGPSLGIHEFGIKAWAGSYGGSQLMLYVPGSNYALGEIDTSFYLEKYPFALDNGAVISSGDSNWIPGPGWQFLDWTSSSLPNGCDFASNWCGSVDDKFLGLKFLLDGAGTDYYYGWVRINFPDGAFPGTFTVKDYAYNETAGTSIMAGEGIPLGIDDNMFSNVKIVALNKSIGLYNLPKATNYKLFSITGQEVLKGNTKDNTHVIEASVMASGVYIIEIADADSTGVLRKKIVL